MGSKKSFSGQRMDPKLDPAPRVGSTLELQIHCENEEERAKKWEKSNRGVFLGALGHSGTTSFLPLIVWGLSPRCWWVT